MKVITEITRLFPGYLTEEQCDALHRVLNERDKLAAANAELLEALREALEHLDWCGWGDKWERECSEDLRKRLPGILAKHTPKEGA